MNHNINELKARLSQAGITLIEPTTVMPLQAPWFVRGLQAFSGWLAALFLLGFIATGLVFVVESPAASMGVGLAMVGAAFALLRMARGDVLEHMALAVSLAGQLLIAWGIVELWELSNSLWWLLFGLQAMLALVMPSRVHRSFSALAASLALYMALSVSAMGQVASGILLLALTLLWLNEFRWPRRINAMQAWGYGLLIGLLFIQCLALSGQPFWFWFDHQSRGDFAWLAPWLSVVLIAISLILLLYAVFQRHLPFKTHKAQLTGSVFVGAAALLLITFYAPGIGQGVVVLLLGFAIGHRVLVGLGVFSLLEGIVSFYYWLDVTLLTKALTLLLVGGFLLVMRWGLRRWLGAFRTQPSGGSLDNEE